MYSKENDRNLRISKIHHKRKDSLNKIKTFGRMLSMVLVILVIGQGIGSAQQLVMLDVTYDHTTATKAFSLFNIPSGVPSNLVYPVDYAHGTLYQRLQVFTKPNTMTVRYQFCVFQDQIITSKHACSDYDGLVFKSPGTYFSKGQSMTSLFQYNNIQWSRSLLKELLAVKDANGIPVDDQWGWAGKWIGSPNFALYYPMKVRYTAIIVPPGGGAPVWPSGDNSNSIAVTSPNGGENWIIGTNKMISWSSSGSPGTYVKIELLKGGIVNKVINSYTPNDGSYSWYIPSTQTLGTDYKIRVTSTSNSAYTDTSNNNFIIGSSTSTQSITVMSPNGGEKWIRGVTNTIKWSYTGSTGSYVRIELLKGGIVNKVINSYTLNDGSYSWYIPSTQTLGADYKIRITSTSKAIYADTSNNNFVISTPSLIVVSPNGWENWNRGTTHAITWSKTGSPGAYVKIELLKGGIVNKVINSYTLNDGYYSWYISPYQTIGSDYKIRITSTSNSIYNDMSNNYFKIY